MERPRVAIEGYETDLNNLATLGGDRWVVERTGKVFWLSCPDFDGMVHDPAAIRAAAEWLLPILNGFAALQLPDFHPVKLGQAVDYTRADGRPRRRLTITVDVQSRSGEQAVPVEHTNEDVHVATTEAAVGKALTIFAQRPCSWDALYRVFEIVREDVGREVIESWTTRAAIRSFTWSAAAERHATDQLRTPPTPMTLADARD